jgi:hypothetical protein
MPLKAFINNNYNEAGMKDYSLADNIALEMYL